MDSRLVIGPVPGRRQRLARPVYQRDRSVWLLLLSLGLHLAVLVGLLLKPSTPPPAGVPEAMPVEFVMEKGPAEAALGAPAPAELPAPEVPVTPAETAPAPAPAPDVTPPPVQQVETPPPVPTSAPDVVASAQQAELPLPAVAPAPIPAPPPPPLPTPTPPAEPLLPTPPLPPPAVPPPPVPPQPVAPAHAPPPPTVAQTRPRRPPPPRAAARPADTNTQTSAQTSPGDAPARATEGQNAPGRATAGNNGAAWMGRLKQWWDQNSFYPKEASQTDEGGNVRVHIVISGDGRVTSIDVVQSSGSAILDSAAVAVFRNAHLPPLPPGTPPLPADVVVTLHYRPSNGGR